MSYEDPRDEWQEFETIEDDELEEPLRVFETLGSLYSSDGNDVDGGARKVECRCGFTVYVSWRERFRECPICGRIVKNEDT